MYHYLLYISLHLDLHLTRDIIILLKKQHDNIVKADVNYSNPFNP